MKLMLHAPDVKNDLSIHYRRAFANSTELFIVTAYLTEWDGSLRISASCKFFRFVIGKDFGITRKAACYDVMKWLPKSRKSEFLVASSIDGFHPKAIFWAEPSGKFYAIVGSSNLTKAAFKTNYEANGFAEITSREYEAAKLWLGKLEANSIVVTPDWILGYKEALRPSGGGGKSVLRDSPVPLALPNPKNSWRIVRRRRSQLDAYAAVRADIRRLFVHCAGGAISSEQFYERLPRYWSHDARTRLQGNGWERQGRSSNFKLLAQSFLSIRDAEPAIRDDVVGKEIDALSKAAVASRSAFLSEMLCLEFPSMYPVLNGPVSAYLKSIKFRHPRGATEGAKYINIAKRLRFSLLSNPKHPAKNIAELDAVIWLAHDSGHF